MQRVRHCLRETWRVHSLTHGSTLDGIKSALLILCGFAALWAAFFFLSRDKPFISNGADVIKEKKKEFEAQGKTFKNGRPGLRLAIFGDSKVLSGFIPDDFDALARRDSLSVNSFNSGFPGQTEFLDELNTMLDQENPPDVVLLTKLWEHRARHVSFFNLSIGDNQLASEFFPFRFYMRDVARFVAESHRHGGILALYRYTKDACNQVQAARGYYYIKELKVLPDGKLPPAWSLPSDNPREIVTRKADFDSAELDRLNTMLERRHVLCFYVPGHMRSTEAAPAPSNDTEFELQLERHSRCRALGPDYFSYSPILYSDDIHLNPDGAKVYTEDLYKLVAPRLGRSH
jgi:hypothetical protein